LPRKPADDDDEEFVDDEETDDEEAEEEDEDEDSDEDEDTIDLDQAEEEEDDDDLDDDDDEDEAAGESADDLERRRLFREEAEEILENLTMDDVKEVLKENDQDASLAPRLKKLLVEVIEEGEMTSMDDAWDEALERLEE
jgi:hypothetical protein